MKTVSDDLFQLIKAMSKQEKRYFKLFASRHVIGEKNKYVMLFDAIDRQNSYDEQRIRQRFAGEKFTRQLHVVKNYLYNLLLHSLRNYHEQKSGEPFYTWMRNARLLFDKGLYKQSEKILTKAKKWAMENEQFLPLLEISRWEHQIAHSRNDFAQLKQYVSEGLKQEFTFLDKYRNFLEFQALNDRVFIPYWQKGTIRSAAEKAALKQLFARPIFQSEDQADSFYARYFYHNARFSYHLFLGEPAESYPHIRRLVNMFAALEAGKIKGRLIRNYSSALINLYIVQRQLGKFAEIPATLAQLRQVPVESPEQKHRLLVRSINLEIDLYLYTGQFSQGVQQITPLLPELQIDHNQINRQQRLGLWYNLAYLHFGAARYHLALDWINRLLDDPDLKTRADINSFGRLLNLVIHYELGNDQLLEYIVKNTARFLAHRKRLFKVEAVMLKLMRQYSRWLNKTDRIAGFESLIRELEALQDDEFESKAFEYFNFIAWMRSQVEPLRFEELVQRERGVLRLRSG